MQVILTPTAVPDLFGPGLNGFKGSIPPLPPPTQLSAEWLNSVQMELVSILLSQGIALDGLQFDQVAQALANWSFAGNTKIISGGSLTVQSGATFTCDLGSAFVVNSTTPTFGAFTEVSMLGDVIIGTDSGNTLTINSVSTFNEGVTVIAGKETQLLGDVTLGTDSGDALTIESTAAMNADLAIVGALGGSLSADTAALMTWNGTANRAGRLRVNAGISSTIGDLSRNVGNLQWHDGTGTRYVHVNPGGWVKGHGHVTTAGAAAATLSFDTDTAVAPLAAATLDVFATAWISRAIAGPVTVYLTEVGVGVIGTSAVIDVVATGGTKATPVTFARPHSASTTPRIYRFTVDGGGQNVRVNEGRIVVTPTI